jgi:hypothetical protein
VSNHCFAIGLGSGADVDLVQGIADSTGGRADFVSDGENLVGKVIGRLETSLRGVLTNVSIELSDVDGIEFAPFPIPPISAAVAQTVFGGCQNPVSQVEILISGDFLGEPIDEVVESHEVGLGKEVLKALFGYETIRKSETSLRKDSTLRTKIIQLSIESGVLCRETALYFSLSSTFGFFQCSIVLDQPVNARKDPNVADREKYKLLSLDSQMRFSVGVCVIDGL